MIPKYQLGHQYKPNLRFSPSSDEGSLEADQKAANLCLLQPPPAQDEPQWSSDLRELEALEREAEEAEASRCRADAAAEGFDEEEAWLSHAFDLDEP
jgi:hypothetical protein